MNRLLALTITITFLTAPATMDVYAGSAGDYCLTWRGPHATGAAEKGKTHLYCITNK